MIRVWLIPMLFLILILALGCQEQDSKVPQGSGTKAKAKDKIDENSKLLDPSEEAKAALKGKRDKAEADIRSIMTALKMHKIEEGFYPKTLKALLSRGQRGGPWLESLENDPWGHDYHYQNSAGRLRLVSYGKDGALGGVGDAEDVDPFPLPKVNSGGKKAVR
ncbi:MAG: type II secretion system protein GspG [Planctomycetota bacterium]|nr:type II secretion system protein GspG [Planctomycetota bacterium]